MRTIIACYINRLTVRELQCDNMTSQFTFISGKEEATRVSLIAINIPSPCNSLLFLCILFVQKY